MANNRVKLKTPNGNVIETSKDMVEYYSKMGYTKVSDIDTKPIINKVKLKKEK